MPYEPSRDEIERLGAEIKAEHMARRRAEPGTTRPNRRRQRAVTGQPASPVRVVTYVGPECR